MRAALVVAAFALCLGCVAVEKHDPGLRPTPSKVEPAVRPAGNQKRPANERRLHQLSALPTTTVTIGKNKIKVWVMKDESTRQEGMMFLSDREVKASEGMLFVFPSASGQSFWMRNTLIPLDIAFIGPHKKIVNIGQMKPLDENGTPSTGPAQYVLEMKKGAFRRLGIKAGMKVGIPASVRTDR